MKTKGFSLVELLVVMGVSGILLMALATIFVTQSKTYAVYSDAGETQQAAKIVLDYIAKEVRMAGSGLVDRDYYMRGATTPFLHISSLNSSTGPDAIRIRGNFQGIFGIISSAAATIPKDDETPSSTPWLVYKDRSQFSVGNFLTVNDGSKSEVRFVKTVTNTTTAANVEFNAGDGFSSDHNKGVFFNGIQELRYSLNGTTLYRNNFEGTGNQPILENVEEIQFQYGIDSNGDGRIDQWLDNIATKERLVRAVKIWLLVRGTAVDANMNDTRSYVMGDRTYTPASAVRTYHRYLFSTVVELRNYYFGS